MPSDSETEASELASINADLNQLASHVSSWLNDRFLSSETATDMNLEDIAGLILWLQQWHLHFNGYDESATTLADAGLPALADRLAEIRREIDSSITNFTEMAAKLLEPPPEDGEPPPQVDNGPTSRQRLAERRRSRRRSARPTPRQDPPG